MNKCWILDNFSNCVTALLILVKHDVVSLLYTGMHVTATMDTRWKQQKDSWFKHQVDSVRMKSRLNSSDLKEKLLHVTPLLKFWVATCMRIHTYKFMYTYDKLLWMSLDGWYIPVDVSVPRGASDSDSDAILGVDTSKGRSISHCTLASAFNEVCSKNIMTGLKISDTII